MTTRTNRYADTCRDCGHEVPASEGRLNRGPGGWEVRHRDEATCQSYRSRLGHAEAPRPGRANRFPDACVECDREVPVGEGALTRGDNGWELRHSTRSACLEAAASEPARYEPEAGEFHQLDDGTVIRVRENRAGTRVYTQRAEIRNRRGWNGTLESEAADIAWIYDPAARRSLSDDTRMTAEQAAEFGRTTGRCVFCSHRITTPESLTVGYGPTCAERRGLPWGGVDADRIASSPAVPTASSSNPTPTASYTVSATARYSSRSTTDDEGICDRCGEEFISTREAAAHACEAAA